MWTEERRKNSDGIRTIGKHKKKREAKIETNSLGYFTRSLDVQNRKKEKID